MLKSWLLLSGILLMAGCNPSAPPETQETTSWQGELRILPGDTAFIPCGTLQPMRITGPGLDSLARRYAQLKAVEGQWIMTWCDGHAEADGNLLVATAFMHMDAETHCAPVPVDSLSGSWLAVAQAPGGLHAERLEFLPDGRALIITSTPDLYAEVDGHWGLDSDGDVVFTEQTGRFSFYYGRSNGALMRPIPGQGREVVYQYNGPADPLAGAPGWVAQLLAGAANTHGMAMEAGHLRADMALDSLFPDPQVRTALHAVIADTLGLDQSSLDRLREPDATVGGLTQMMRARMRANP